MKQRKMFHNRKTFGNWRDTCLTSSSHHRSSFSSIIFGNWSGIPLTLSSYLRSLFSIKCTKSHFFHNNFYYLFAIICPKKLSNHLLNILMPNFLGHQNNFDVLRSFDKPTTNIFFYKKFYIFLVEKVYKRDNMQKISTFYLKRETQDERKSLHMTMMMVELVILWHMYWVILSIPI